MMDNGILNEWTTTTLRVRYAETDQMGVVYYANYLVWFEIGRTDFCRQHGFAYKEMEQQNGRRRRARHILQCLIPYRLMAMR